MSSTSFQTLVRRYKGDYKVKEFSCWKQVLCMAFGQLTHRESLTDALMCLKANAHKMYHLRIGELVANSTLSKANENRSSRTYQDLAMLLKTIGVLYDQTVMLNNHFASKDYPEKLRRIKSKDEVTGKELVFLSNNFQGNRNCTTIKTQMENRIIF